MQCCIPHPCSSPETRRFREDSEKIPRRFEDSESFAKAHFEYVVDLQGVSFATSWPCRAHQVLAPQCGTGWHLGGERFMVFQCVSRTFTEFSMLEQLFTIVYMEVSFALCQLFQLPQCCALEPLQTASKQYSILFRL